MNYILPFNILLALLERARLKVQIIISQIKTVLLSLYSFKDKILLNDELIEVACFNDWFYGTCYESLRSDVINVGIFNPSAVEQLVLHKDIDLTIFYIKASDKNRLLRALNREENPNVDEIVRRFLADKKDFQDLDFQMHELQNNTLDDLNSNLKFIQARIEELQDKTY